MTIIANRFRQQFNNLFSTDSNPHEIALGFAVGTFVELLPAFGVKTALSLFIAGTIRSVNKVALLTALTVWNSFFIIPVYSASYELGNQWAGDGLCTAGTGLFSASIDCLLRGFLPAVLLVGAIISITMYIMVRLSLSFVRKKPSMQIRSKNGRISRGR